MEIVVSWYWKWHWHHWYWGETGKKCLQLGFFLKVPNSLLDANEESQHILIPWVGKRVLNFDVGDICGVLEKNKVSLFIKEQNPLAWPKVLEEGNTKASRRRESGSIWCDFLVPFGKEYTRLKELWTGCHFRGRDRKFFYPSILRIVSLFVRRVGKSKVKRLQSLWHSEGNFSLLLFFSSEKKKKK